MSSTKTGYKFSNDKSSSASRRVLDAKENRCCKGNSKDKELPTPCNVKKLDGTRCTNISMKNTKLCLDHYNNIGKFDSDED